MWIVQLTTKIHEVNCSLWVDTPGAGPSEGCCGMWNKCADFTRQHSFRGNGNVKRRENMRFVRSASPINSAFIYNPNFIACHQPFILYKLFSLKRRQMVKIIWVDLSSEFTLLYASFYWARARAHPVRTDWLIYQFLNFSGLRHVSFFSIEDSFESLLILRQTFIFIFNRLNLYCWK